MQRTRITGILAAIVGTSATLAQDQPPAPPRATKDHGYAQRVQALAVSQQPAGQVTKWTVFPGAGGRMAGVSRALERFDPAGLAAARADHVEDAETAGVSLGAILANAAKYPASAAWLRAWFDRAEEKKS